MVQAKIIVKVEAKINIRSDLNNNTKEFLRKSRSPITFYVFALKLWWKELQSKPKSVLLNGLDVKGMLWRNVEHFLKKRIEEKLGQLKKIFFFFFQPSVFLIFVKIWTPPLHFIFGWQIYDVINKQVLRIISWSLLLNVWSFFRFSLNFDPVKEIMKIRCQIYILLKKVIKILIWGKYLWKWSLSLHRSPP